MNPIKQDREGFDPFPSIVMSFNKTLPETTLTRLGGGFSDIT
jgi:hypothetical protein